MINITRIRRLTALKLIAFLFTILFGMSCLSLASQSRTAFATTRTLAEKVSDPYYKYKYAYKHKDTSALSKNELKFYKNLKKCLDSAKKNKMKYKQEKAVYDWIILNCKYDYENYKENKIPTSSFHPEGVFLKGTAVCNGYAESFQLCMDILSIPCKTITGTDALTNEGHAWNAVKLDDGKWYQVDTTWGDPVPNQKGKIDYRYYNLTDKEMKKSHTYTSSVSCKATKYNYWNTYGKATKHITTETGFYKVVIDAINNHTGKVEIALDYSLRNQFLYDFSYVYQKTRILADYNLTLTNTTVTNGCLYYDLTIDDKTVAGVLSDASEFKAAITSAYNNRLSSFKIYVSDSKFVADNYSSTVISSYNLMIDTVFLYCNKVENSDLYKLSITFNYMDDSTLADQDAVISKIGEYIHLAPSDTNEIYTIYMVKPSGIQGNNLLNIKNQISTKISSTYGITDFNVHVDTYTAQTLKITFSYMN